MNTKVIDRVFDAVTSCVAGFLRPTRVSLGRNAWAYLMEGRSDRWLWTPNGDVEASVDPRLPLDGLVVWCRGRFDGYGEGQLRQATVDNLNLLEVRGDHPGPFPGHRPSN